MPIWRVVPFTPTPSLNPLITKSTSTSIRRVRAVTVAAILTRGYRSVAAARARAARQTGCTLLLPILAIARRDRLADGRTDGPTPGRYINAYGKT